MALWALDREFLVGSKYEMMGICFPFTTHQSPGFLERKPLLTHKHPDSGGTDPRELEGCWIPQHNPIMSLIAKGPGDGLFLVQ